MYDIDEEAEGTHIVRVHRYRIVHAYRHTCTNGVCMGVPVHVNV